MNRKGGILADVLLILIGFAVGTFFGTFILNLIKKALEVKIPLT
jgi:uncharacterized membrane protein YwzB